MTPRLARRFLALVPLVFAAAGCFALFPLDDYNQADGDAGADTGTNGGDSGPSNPVDVFVPPPPEGENQKRVFVTSGSFDGNFGGLDGADEACKLTAKAAGLSGTYRAWLSDGNDGGTPLTRFSYFQDAGLSPDNVRLTDVRGETLVPTVAYLLSQQQFTAAPLERDEKGVSVTGDAGLSTGCGTPGTVAVWTGTNANGTLIKADTTCSNWGATSGSGDLGIVTGKIGAWTHPGCSLDCAATLHLYCFEQ